MRYLVMQDACTASELLSRLKRRNGYFGVDQFFDVCFETDERIFDADGFETYTAHSPIDLTPPIHKTVVRPTHKHLMVKNTGAFGNAQHNFDKLPAMVFDLYNTPVTFSGDYFKIVVCDEQHDNE